MEAKEVYDNGGESLGDEWVDLSGLQHDTKVAILHMMYLDETVDLPHCIAAEENNV